MSTSCFIWAGPAEPQRGDARRPNQAQERARLARDRRNVEGLARGRGDRGARGCGGQQLLHQVAFVEVEPAIGEQQRTKAARGGFADLGVRARGFQDVGDRLVFDDRLLVGHRGKTGRGLTGCRLASMRAADASASDAVKTAKHHRLIVTSPLSLPTDPLSAGRRGARYRRASARHRSDGHDCTVRSGASTPSRAGARSFRRD